jgi:Zn-dependent protease
LSEEFIIKLLIIALVIYGTSLHEMAHAYVATWLGDPTPGRAGRLTLNPIPHLNPPFTAIILPAVMFLSSGGLICLAQTPIDPSRFRRPLRDHALVALAGPAMNLLFMGVLIGVLWIPGVWNPNFTAIVFAYAALWNLILAVFNLLPLPPLDGYWFVRAFLPLRLRIHTDSFARMGMVSLVLVLVVGSYAISYLEPYLSQVFAALLPH